MAARRRYADRGADAGPVARRPRPSPAMTPGARAAFERVCANNNLVIDLLDLIGPGGMAALSLTSRLTHRATQDALKDAVPQCEAWVAEFVTQFEDARRAVRQMKAAPASAGAAAAAAAPDDLQWQPFVFRTPMPGLAAVRAYLHTLRTAPSAGQLDPWPFLANHAFSTEAAADARDLQEGAVHHGFDALAVVDQLLDTQGVLALARLALVFRHMREDASVPSWVFFQQVPVAFGQLLFDIPTKMSPGSQLAFFLVGLYLHLVWRHSPSMHLVALFADMTIPVMAVRLHPPMKLRDYRWFELGPEDLNYTMWGSVMTAGDAAQMDEAVDAMVEAGLIVLAPAEVGEEDEWEAMLQGIGLPEAGDFLEMPLPAQMEDDAAAE